MLKYEVLVKATCQFCGVYEKVSAPTKQEALGMLRHLYQWSILDEEVCPGCAYKARTTRIENDNE